MAIISAIGTLRRTGGEILAGGGEGSTDGGVSGEFDM
jgi:hypothetical protein